jgi:predicted transcriptional regulator
MRLSADQQRLLLAIARGQSLKSHRDVEGRKVYRLHALDGSSERVARSVVTALAELGLVNSNQKFPAATYWLTEKGQTLATELQRRAAH